MNIIKAYQNLLDAHGRQGWWPLPSRGGENGFDEDGYHPGIYDAVSTSTERFEVCLGSVLTQNIAWSNALKALKALHEHNIYSADDVLTADNERLKDHIRPAGHYNQKTTYINNLADYFEPDITPTRQALLGVNGVGQETADTILLHAYHEPRIIADTYTERWLHSHDIPVSGYDDVQQYIDQRFPRNTAMRNELHALIVADGKT